MPPPARSVGRAAQEAQGRALPGLLRVRDHEDGVQGEEGGGQLGVGVVVARLAADRGHAPQEAGREGGAAGGGKEAGGRRVGLRGVHHVLERGRGADLEVLVLDADAEEPEPDEVDDVRDDRVRGQDARSPGERSHPLGGELLGLLDPRRTVIAANPSRQQ